MRSACVLFAAALAACNQTGLSPDGEPFDQVAGFAGTPVMQPGADCMHCHEAGGVAADRAWSIAGTVFSSSTACSFFDPDAGTGCPGGVQGVQVLLTDSNGQQLTLTTNSAGNFYTDQPIGTLTSIMIQNGKQRMIMNLDSVGGGGDLPAYGLGPNRPDSGAVSCNECHRFETPEIPFGGYSSPGSLFIPND